MIIKPKFYDSFRCIADKCPDTCCAGWEIDVDEATADYYDSLPGGAGEFVKSKLIHRDDGVKLCLEGERCRFLREDNLCELIIRLGDEALCDICREHPRFYFEYEDITEVGVGLCCPEAARLWLSEPCEFVSEADEVSGVYENPDAVRKLALISELADESLALGKQLANLIQDESESELYPELKRLYGGLSCLDPNFGERFATQPEFTADPRFRRLIAYFIFRYYFELGEETTVKFAAVSAVIIAAMGSDLIDDAVAYSKEVEYDTDNVEKICDFLRIHEGLGKLCIEIFGE